MRIEAVGAAIRPRGHRWTLLLVLGLVGAGCTRESAKEGFPNPDPGFRPNIVWIVAEDMSPTIPSFGDSTIATPSLSLLAEEGVRYTHFFAAAAVCGPSRASITTGLYPGRFGAQHMRTGPWYRGRPSPEQIARYEATGTAVGIPAYEALPPPSVRMLSEELRRAGYYTSNDAKEDYQFLMPVTAWDVSEPGADWSGRRVGQPFYSVINLEVTHESRIWALADTPLEVPADLDVPVPPYLPDTEVGRADIRRMYSNIVLMDRQVGAVLDRLREEQLLDSTIVIWYTDHGGPLPRQKRALQDSGLRVPMIIRFPQAARAGEVDARMLSFLDLKPTMLSLAGIDPGDELDGRAFLGPWADPVPRTYVHAAADRFDQVYDGIRAVRDERFKYLRHLLPGTPCFVPVPYREQMAIMRELYRLRDEGTLSEIQAQWFCDARPAEQLFDTVNDPHEVHDLATDPAFANKLSELRTEADRWTATLGPFDRMPEDSLVRILRPEERQPVTEIPMLEVEGLVVRMTSDTEGASIGYQLLEEESRPGKSWRVYEEPVTVRPGTRVVALAHRLGFLPSDTTSVRVDRP